MPSIAGVVIFGFVLFVLQGVSVWCQISAKVIVQLAKHDSSCVVADHAQELDLGY